MLSWDSFSALSAGCYTLVPLLDSKPYLEFTVTEPGEVLRLRAYDGAVYLPTMVTAAYDEVMVLSICQKTEAGLSALLAYVDCGTHFWMPWLYAEEPRFSAASASKATRLSVMDIVLPLRSGQVSTLLRRS